MKCHYREIRLSRVRSRPINKHTIYRKQATITSGWASMSEEVARTRSTTPTDVPGPRAREFTLDLPRIPSIEFPLKVSQSQESIEKVINMCGGLPKVRRALAAHSDSSHDLELRLNDGSEEDGRPQFFNEHPIIGKRVQQRDEAIVLKISMPRGTMERNDGDVRKALASLPASKVKAVPVAILHNTVRFREMSDFQVRLDNNPSAKEFNDSFGTLNWEKFKKFVETIPDYDDKPFENIGKVVFDRASVCPSSDFQLPPIPRFSMVGLPFIYKYRSNPYATKTASGESKVVGTYIKNYQQFVHDFSPSVSVPLTPHPELVKQYELAKKTKVYPGSKSDSKFYEKLEQCLPILTELFNRRHVWIKRHIDGIIPQDLHVVLKIALSLVSYRFTKGPWRNTYIKLGVDPRSSNEYAKYQTEYFKIERRLLRNTAVRKNVPDPPERFYRTNTPNDIDSRFRFDGKQIPWYLMLQIDLLTDEPNIKEVFQNAVYLDTPKELTGWFSELDLTKIRKIVKYELGCMVQGNYEFNEHKLKYFKVMLYVKETLSSKDGDGDVHMTDEKEDAEDEDEDNGVETGELDETVLQADEEDEDEIPMHRALTQPEGSEDSDEFSIKTASFKEIVERIARSDPETADYLAKDLDGFVLETQI
ncbi:ADL376Wp [Eremothecium gossypii ATCC 10895]|uniref:ADL376Wp n=1 Tax=Eremothecium gossypii (strain ATCC 10895 / CBS 109.51 / FGSC 9923 / NRRL Y-1056) TaxID=284811 RepID=Q75BE0_EREGS|nr:ADL376Wp [Eremothecium gossypii ATCC 10895]AAS51544.2 ADL376Wp [Eremothecium gossypii ATCC 10895]